MSRLWREMPLPGDRQALIARAAAWMQARGWKAKLAKRRDYEQSLFEHSLIELDVLVEDAQKP